jgi:hypothetical protein
MREQGFIRPNLEARYLVRDRVEEILPALRAAVEAQTAPHLALRPEF